MLTKRWGGRLEIAKFGYDPFTRKPSFGSSRPSKEGVVRVAKRLECLWLCQTRPSKSIFSQGALRFAKGGVTGTPPFAPVRFVALAKCKEEETPFSVRRRLRVRASMCVLSLFQGYSSGCSSHAICCTPRNAGAEDAPGTSGLSTCRYREIRRKMPRS